MVKVGIVAEGRSDWEMIEEITKTLYSDVEFERICPDYQLASPPNKPFGWKGVRAWCKENGRRLKIIMEGVIGRELELLIIHVDASMADKVLRQLPPCPPASSTTDQLRDIMTSKWLKLDSLPDYVVLVTPSKMTDTWIVATLNHNRTNIECDFEVEEVLAQQRLLPRKKGEVKKPRNRYLPLAQRVARQLNNVRSVCTEADRFVREFQAAYSSVSASS